MRIVHRLVDQTVCTVLLCRSTTRASFILARSANKTWLDLLASFLRQRRGLRESRPAFGKKAATDVWSLLSM